MTFHSCCKHTRWHCKYVSSQSNTTCIPHISNAAVADGDYVPVAGEIVQFNKGDVTKNHTIIINDDNECEKDPNENFFSNIALDSGIPDITVTVPRAMVTLMTLPSQSMVR